MASEERWKRLIFRWTAPKGFVAIMLFFALAFLFEYLMIYFFTFSGLTDNFTFKFFTITISPLFHLMPLGVIFVLISSWMYLTKYVAVVPRRTSPAKKPLETRRRRPRRARKMRFKSLRNFFGKIGRKFGRVGRAVKAPFRRIGAAFLRIRGVSYVQRRLFFARAAVKSTATVLTVFLVSVLALYILVYPNLFHDLAIRLYSANPSFHGFVLKTIEIGQGIAQALSPIGWLASTINEALRGVAPGFRNTIEGLGASITQPLTNLDLVWKYTLSQNAAAWISAIVALAYGEYTSSVYRIRKPR
ncbi:MAG: hypothetical protein ACE5HG_03400 [Candidatus Bathyarchaeia archaeon]